MYEIKLLTKEQIKNIIPFLQMLDEKIPVQVLNERMEEMMSKNYTCVAVFEGEKIIGISGLWILNKYYVGRHIEPDNVIIHPDYRSKGIGELMMNWIFEYAVSLGCRASELNCYVSNSAGIRFWINQGFRIIGFHLQKLL